MKKYLYGLAIAVLIFLLWFAYNYPDWIVAGPPHDQKNSQTCPQFVRGYDDNGNPICGYVTGCPYGDSIPLGPECDKHGPLPDPDRPYYDGQGNKYDYQGNLIEEMEMVGK